MVRGGSGGLFSMPSPSREKKVPKAWVANMARKVQWTYEPCKDLIGQGSFGIVRTAVARSITGDSTVGVWEPLVAEEVVIKHISKAKVAAYRSSVQNEVSIFKVLTSHPGFPKLYDVFEDKENVLLVMEYCKGGELTEAITKLAGSSETHVAAVFSQIMNAVLYMHNQNIIHRDIKPENFLLKEPLGSEMDPTQLKICCADFGLARRVDDGDQLDDASGTLDFMAPEQLGNIPYLGKPADIWSCGCILYLLLCGRLPFEGPNRHILQTKIRGAMLDFMPREVWDNISDSAKDLIRKMMSLDWQHRITAQEVLEHPWFAECSARGADPSAAVPQLDATVAAQLKDFSKWSAVKRGLTFQLAKYLSRSADSEGASTSSPAATAASYLGRDVLKARREAPPPLIRA